MECYFAIGANPKDPAGIRGDVEACARRFNARGTRFNHDQQRHVMEAWVAFASPEEAQGNLERLKDCIEERGNQVVSYSVQ